jgi:hypothetical protein
MMTKLLTLLLSLFATCAMAGDTGLYTDETRYGEGITLVRNGDIVQFFLFTYEPNSECWNFENLPEVTDWSEHTCHEQRWFLTGGDELTGDTVSGFLFSTVGIDYPEGGSDPDDPFASVVGDDFVIGQYILRRQGTGWRMVVFPVGIALSADDPLYNTTFNFNLVVLKANDPPDVVDPQ